MTTQREVKCGIGVDFGTTNSSVALFDCKDVVNVEFPMEEGTIVPSAIYIRRTGLSPAVGGAAVDAYFRHNAGHAVQLKAADLGELDLHAADQTFTFQIHGLAEADMPGRLLRSLKRWLGDEKLETMQIFEWEHPVPGLIARILSYLGTGIGLMDGETVCLGRPVHFGGVDDVAQERLAAAAAEAGMSPSFYPEPVAAAVSYLHGRARGDTGTYLCFDFGGGTLDVCVLKASGDRFRILATYGIPLGGDVIDQLIYKHKVFPELGDGCPLTLVGPGGSERTYLFHLFQYEEELLNWQLSHRLNRPEVVAPVRRHMKLDGETGLKFRRLHAVIRRNLSYAVLRAIEQAKIELSERQEATIEVPTIDMAVPITRAEFEGYMVKPLDDIEGCLRTVLDRAAVSEAEITNVICTGGSSRIPAVQARLEQAFGRPVVEHETFAGVASGLALAHYHGYVSPLGATGGQ